MSTSDAPAGGAAGTNQVTLPAGWIAGPARETSTTNQAGQVVQGVLIPLSNATGTQSTVFVPYTVLLAGAEGVQALFDQRIAALQLLPGQGA